jgi:hypothetical protein
MIPLLLQAGADPTAIVTGAIDSRFRVNLRYIEVNPEAVVLVKALAKEGGRTSLLVHARRVVMIGARTHAASAMFGSQGGKPDTTSTGASHEISHYRAWSSHRHNRVKTRRASGCKAQ